MNDHFAGGNKVVELKIEKTIMDKLNKALGDDPDVLFAYLFGSTASGLSHPHSDLDIACYVREGDDVVCTVKSLGDSID